MEYIDTYLIWRVELHSSLRAECFAQCIAVSHTETIEHRALFIAGRCRRFVTFVDSSPPHQYWEADFLFRRTCMVQAFASASVYSRASEESDSCARFRVSHRVDAVRDGCMTLQFVRVVTLAMHGLQLQRVSLYQPCMMPANANR